MQGTTVLDWEETFGIERGLGSLMMKKKVQ